MGTWHTWNFAGRIGRMKLGYEPYGSRMEYGQIAVSKSINETIYRCFDRIYDGDVPRFVRKFKEQLNDDTQVMHTFRELVLGAYLASRGLDVRYEFRFDEATPDWCFVDESIEPTAIVEVVNFHLDRMTENSIEPQRQANEVWVGWQRPNDDRLYQSIQRKANRYQALVQKHKLPYVVALFGEFIAVVNSDELNACLYGENGIFEQHAQVSGLLYFEENAGTYQFRYIPNPNPCFRFEIPDGAF